jgi:hypothetical protein
MVERISKTERTMLNDLNGISDDFNNTWHAWIGYLLALKRQKAIDNDQWNAWMAILVKAKIRHQRKKRRKGSRVPSPLCSSSRRRPA